MADLYKIKENCEASTSEFWYDLFDGGNISPKEILEDANDIKEVEDAVKILKKFQRSCDEQTEGFYF